MPPPDTEGPEGEVPRVEVVLEVEDPREAGPVPVGVLPAAVLPLRRDEVLDAMEGGRAVLAGREESEERPRRLARSRGAPPRALRDRVGVTALAPAPVGILTAQEPGGRAADHWVVAGDFGRLERSEDRPRPVEKIDAPSPVPGPLGRLGPAEMGEAALDGRPAGHVVEPPEALDAPGGEVLRRGGEARPVVGEGDVVEEEPRLVGIERPPAAVPALHAPEPIETARGGPVDPGLVGV